LTERNIDFALKFASSLSENFNADIVRENKITFRVVIHLNFPEEGFSVRVFFHERGLQG
jgi:hypothetical protein